MKRGMSWSGSGVRTSMDRRAALAALTGAAAGLARGTRRAGDKPNLLFLWTDQQRVDTLAVYGNRRFRVPALNKLAETSVAFERCYDSHPICTPARSTVMTGLWPHTNGCIANNIPLQAQTQALPELLDDPAYRTAYMGKWHLGDEIYAQHGFQEWVSIEDIYTRFYSASRSRDDRSSYHHFLLDRGYEPDDPAGPPKFSREFAVRLPLEHCKPEFLANEACRFIRENRSQPWMLYVNYLEPHMPFFGPLNDLHSEEEAPIPENYPGFPIEKEPELYRRSREKYLRRGYEGHDLQARAGWQRLNRNYAGLCSQVDRSVERVLKVLEDTGQAENTIVVFTSDHGEMMGSHSLIGKEVFYEEAVRVPFLLRAPFRKLTPQRVAEPVSHIDLVPTLLELMNSSIPDLLPGESLLSLLAGKKRREDHVFCEWHTPPEGPNARSVVSPDGWKMVVFDTDNCLLFNLKADPLESRNLYYRSESAPVIHRLRAKLAAWQKRTADPLQLPDV